LLQIPHPSARRRC